LLEGFLLGVREGVFVGLTEGLEEGFLLGAKEGVLVGFTEGLEEGALLGIKEGEALGFSLVGLPDGCAVPPVGAGVGVGVGGIVGGNVTTGSKQTGGFSVDPGNTTPSHVTGQASLTVLSPPNPVAGLHHFTFLSAACALLFK
jgi:hypothetical protein